MIAKKVGPDTTLEDVYAAYPDIEKEIDEEIDEDDAADAATWYTDTDGDGYDDHAADGGGRAGASLLVSPICTSRTPCACLFAAHVFAAHVLDQWFAR